MVLLHFGATKLDRRIADAIARSASPAVERPARLFDGVADEHLLFVISRPLAGFAGRRPAPASTNRSPGALRDRDRHPAAFSETADRPGTAGSVHDPWPPPWHSAFGQSLLCVSLGDATHVGVIASAISWISPKSAPLAWSLGGVVCRNPDRRGALDDRRARGPGHGCPGGTVSAAAVKKRGPGGHRGAPHARVYSRTAATDRVIPCRHGTVMTLIVILLVTVLLLMFKPTIFLVLVILARFSWLGWWPATSRHRARALHRFSCARGCLQGARRVDFGAATQCVPNMRNYG